MIKAKRVLGNWLGFACAALIVFTIGSAKAAEPLVNVDWVKANSTKAGVVTIDARGKSDYLRGHIPGAVNTNYGKDGWRVSKNGVPGMFPDDTTKLGAMIGGLGVDNASHVVLVAPGNSSSDMGIATRIYWTFKALGHDNVSILNGGMKAYLAAKDKAGKPTNALEKGPAKISAKTFTIALRKDMIPSTADVKASLDAGMFMVDSRTNDQYVGVNRHGKSKASGTIPGATDLPQNWLTENGGGMFRSKDTITALYKAAGVPTSGEQISFCNTGHWASIGWFASSEILGNKDAKMYDASMTGWTAANMPMEAKISLK
ncbi:MAG: sulfurtransferase [Magnetovibrio sp.]|nr:sulfurtransferase [Magnetovibrio sp.]